MNGPGGIVLPGPSRLGRARPVRGARLPLWSSSIVARLVGLRRNLAYFRNYPKTGCNPRKMQDLRAFSDSYLGRHF